MPEPPLRVERYDPESWWIALLEDMGKRCRAESVYDHIAWVISNATLAKQVIRVWALLMHLEMRAVMASCRGDPDAETRLSTIRNLMDDCRGAFYRRPNGKFIHKQTPKDRYCVYFDVYSAEDEAWKIHCTRLAMFNRRRIRRRTVDNVGVGNEGAGPNIQRSRSRLLYPGMGRRDGGGRPCTQAVVVSMRNCMAERPC